MFYYTLCKRALHASIEFLPMKKYRRSLFGKIIASPLGKPTPKGGEACTMKKRWTLLIVTVLIIASLAGCTAYRRPTPTPTPTPTPDPEAPEMPMTPAPQTAQPTTADRVVKVVNSMAEVKSSYAVVVGNVAMVGVDLRDKLTTSQEESLKNRISSETKRQMPELAEVWVTSDPDLVKSIRDLAARISRGEPISGFFDEITQIMRKLEPERS